MLGNAVQIADFRQKKLHINTSNFESILANVGFRPMSLVSINGMMRSGKSYILGHFLRYLSEYEDTKGSPGEGWFTKKLDKEFHWQNSSERQTTGILMWSKPFIIKRNEQEIAVLLMDTQGCFDDKTTNQENALIFALSCLLSSTLIYNVPKQLSEDVLQFMQMFVGYARMSENPNEPQSFSKLVFLIRDWEVPREFPYGYYDETTSSGPKNFKKAKLDVKDGALPEVNIVRDEITTSFQNVACYLMPHPGKGLAIYDKVENVDSDFLEAIKDFVPRLFNGSTIVAKNIGGKEITASELISNVKHWAEYFAKTTIPEPKSIIESTAEFQNSTAYSIAWKFYRNELNKIPDGISDEKFVDAHEKVKKEAFDIFERFGRVKHDEIQKKSRNLLIEAIENIFTSYQQINVTKRNFEELKVKSEEDKKIMTEKIEELKRHTNSNLDSGLNKLIGLGVGSITFLTRGVTRGIASGGKFKEAFEEAEVFSRKVKENFGWKFE